MVCVGGLLEFNWDLYTSVSRFVFIHRTPNFPFLVAVTSQQNVPVSGDFVPLVTKILASPNMTFSKQRKPITKDSYNPGLYC